MIRGARRLLRPRRIIVALAMVGTAALGIALLLASRAASSERDWATDHALPPRVSFCADSVRVEDLRDFSHGADGSFAPAYLSETYALADIRRVWFGLAPFARRWRGLGHTFLSFEIEGDRFLAVSVEARREADETYSLVRGLLRGFELTYVVATEEDVVGLRAARGDTLYLYPSRASAEQARALLIDVLRRAEALKTSPEFYNTLLNLCHKPPRPRQQDRARPSAPRVGRGVPGVLRRAGSRPRHPGHRAAHRASARPLPCRREGAPGAPKR